MFKNLSRISNALTNVVVAACTIDQSVVNLVDSANHATKAISIHASELEQDAIHECAVNAHARKQRMKQFEAELALEDIAAKAE